MLRSLIIALVISLPATPVFAQDTRLGDFGFVLGTAFNKGRVQGIVSQKNGLMIYRVKPAGGKTAFQKILVAVTPANIIFNIIATVQMPDMAGCVQHQRNRLKVLRARFPGLGYYANGDADMIYDKQATVVLSCEEKAGKTIFKLEYLHDEIYQGLSAK